MYRNFVRTKYLFKGFREGRRKKIDSYSNRANTVRGINFNEAGPLKRLISTLPVTLSTHNNVQ